MRIILFGLAVALVVACTKQNPNLCCIDEADCANVGLDEPLGCDDGLLCRGNQCIAEVCAISAECDADAPYCVLEPDGRCQQACTDDSQCPGFGESSANTLCEAGTCVECRTSAECAGERPVCGENACRACSSNDECETGICGTDGACVDESVIAYAAPGGSPSSACTMAEPCALTSALAVAREFVVLEAGAYQHTVPLTVSGRRVLAGRGTPRPTLQNTLTGAVLKIAIGADVSLDNLEVFGATSGANGTGNGVEVLGGNVKLVVRRSVFRDNQFAGIEGRSSNVEAYGSTFRGNAEGARFSSGRGTFDGCTVLENNRGLNLDAELFVVRNNFIVRNNIGLEIFPSVPGNIVEFNTIADNTTGVQCIFSADTPETPFPNNLIARNQTNNTNPSVCTFPNGIVTASVEGLNFVSPDVAPFDYHIQAGSSAIGAAGVTTLGHDFDGDLRPSTDADVGADEL